MNHQASGFRLPLSTFRALLPLAFFSLLSPCSPSDCVDGKPRVFVLSSLYGPVEFYAAYASPERPNLTPTLRSRPCSQFFAVVQLLAYPSELYSQ